MLYYALVISEVILSILLIIFILLQPHEGEGMGAVFGGAGGMDTFMGTKTISVLWKATIVMGILFIGIPILLNLQCVQPPEAEEELKSSGAKPVQEFVEKPPAARKEAGDSKKSDGRT